MQAKQIKAKQAKAKSEKPWQTKRRHAAARTDLEVVGRTLEEIYTKGNVNSFGFRYGSHFLKIFRW